MRMSIPSHFSQLDKSAFGRIMPGSHFYQNMPIRKLLQEFTRRKSVSPLKEGLREGAGWSMGLAPLTVPAGVALGALGGGASLAADKLAGGEDHNGVNAGVAAAGALAPASAVFGIAARDGYNYHAAHKTALVKELLRRGRLKL